MLDASEVATEELLSSRRSSRSGTPPLLPARGDCPSITDTSDDTGALVMAAAESMGSNHIQLHASLQERTLGHHVAKCFPEYSTWI